MQFSFMCVYHQITEGDIWNILKCHHLIGKKTEGQRVPKASERTRTKPWPPDPCPSALPITGQWNIAQVSNFDSPLFLFPSLSFYLKAIFYFILFHLFIFIFGCIGSSLQCAGFSLWWLLLLQSMGSRHAGSVVVAHGLSSCGLRALEHRLSSCGA